MKRKFIITAEMRDLEQRVAKGEISYSRMIEILCEKADEYAEEYHQSELLKLNKSDVISSVCNHTWKLMRNTHYLYRCTKCGIPNEMQTYL